MCIKETVSKRAPIKSGDVENINADILSHIKGIEKYKFTDTHTHHTVLDPAVMMYYR